MVTVNRNTIIDDPWVLKKVDNRDICASFDCGDDDLNEYFHVDAFLHKAELLTETYCLQLEDNPVLAIALLDFCNDAVQLRKMEDELDLDPSKKYPFLPAVKLTRFGVAKKYQWMNIGSHVLNILKTFFVTDNRTGCRFITVDAYNQERVINFYQKNGFKLLTHKDYDKDTRSMFFDLKRLVLT